MTFIAGALSGAQHAGEIDSSENPRELARLLIAITRGVGALGYSTRALRSIEATTAGVITG